MAISYSGITSYGKTGLPSVKSWGSNNNIIRAPPRSITTRKIDKVGDDSSIQQQIQDSDDRTCESIKVYPRGVNQMVSVSYSNTGFKTSASGNNSNNTQAYSMHPVMKDGAFRYPERTSEQDTPLSRLPRAWTSASTVPSFIDFSKRLHVQRDGEKMREIKDITQTNVQPTRVYRKDTAQPFQVKYIIKNPIKVSATSGTRTLDITTQVVKVPTKGACGNVTGNIHMETNQVGVYTKDSSENNLDPRRYLQDVRALNVQTNASSNKVVYDVGNSVDIRTKDLLNITYDTGKSQTSIGGKHLSTTHNLKRSLPEYYAYTNKQRDIHVKTVESKSAPLTNNRPNASVVTNNTKIGDHSQNTSREYRLEPSLKLGGFDGRASLPQQNRTESSYSQSINDRKNKLSSSATQQQFERIRS